MKTSLQKDILAHCLTLLLFALAIAALLAGLLIPTMTGGTTSSKRALAKNDLQNTATAIRSFYIEYARYPQCGQQVNGDSVISAEDQRNLYNIIRSKEGPAPGPQNPRGIVFFEGKITRSNPPKEGFAKDGSFYDPWGNRYLFVIDGDYDGRVTVPMEWNCRDSGKTIKAEVIGFSPGPKTGASKADQQDDVTTW